MRADQRFGRPGIVISEDDLEPFPFGPARLFEQDEQLRPEARQNGAREIMAGMALQDRGRAEHGESLGARLPRSSASDAVRSNIDTAQSAVLAARLRRAR